MKKKIKLLMYLPDVITYKVLISKIYQSEVGNLKNSMWNKNG